MDELSEKEKAQGYDALVRAIGIAILLGALGLLFWDCPTRSFRWDATSCSIGDSEYGYGRD